MTFLIHAAAAYLASFPSSVVKIVCRRAKWAGIARSVRSLFYEQYLYGYEILSEFSEADGWEIYARDGHCAVHEFVELGSFVRIGMWHEDQLYQLYLCDEPSAVPYRVDLTIVEPQVMRTVDLQVAAGATRECVSNRVFALKIREVEVRDITI